MLLSRETTETELKVTVYGDSGLGKTHLGVTPPDPLILLAERQGMATIRRAAALLKKPVPPTFHIANMEQLSIVQRVLANNDDDPCVEIVKRLGRARGASKEEVKQELSDLAYPKPKTIVVDSATEMADLIRDDMEQAAGVKLDDDGLPYMPQNRWGIWKDRFRTLIRAFRDLPYHVLLIALQVEVEFGKGEERILKIMPDTPMKKMPRELMQKVNAVGMIRRVVVVDERDDSGKPTKTRVKRVVSFSAPTNVMAKSFGRLSGDCEPDFTDWLRVIDAEHAELYGEADHG